MTDLKPCPFCGGKPIVFADSVACLDCGVRYYGLLSKSKAVEAWNTRIVSTPTPSKAAVEVPVIMGLSDKDHSEDPAWPPAVQAARLFEYAKRMLLDHADADSAQKAANEALGILKANEQQIEQLHTLLEQEGSEDDR